MGIVVRGARQAAKAFGLLAFLASWIAAPALAQDALTNQTSNANAYPNRVIKIIVPFAAGTTADLIPRMIGDRLTARWGQPVVVENKPGATGNIGAEMVARADPDGYTLLSTAAPPLAINQSLQGHLNFDPAAFVPLSMMTLVPNVLVVSPGTGAKTLAEFIALAKSKPGEITYVSTGPGGTPTLAMELLKLKSGAQIRDIPFRQGTGPGMLEVLGGRIQSMFVNISEGLPHIRSGTVKALGVTTEKRVPQMPDLPAIAETYPGFYSTTWYAMVAPPKTPPAIAAKIAAAVNEILQEPELRAKLEAQSMQVVALPPNETAAFIRAEVDRWREVIKAAGLKAGTQ